MTRLITAIRTTLPNSPVLTGRWSANIALSGVAMAAALGVSFVVPADAPAKAQSSPSPVCLASTGTAQPITVIVTQSRASQLAGQGFASASCAGAPDLATYRAQICGLAQSAPKQVKAGFAGTYGIRPEILCSYAQEIA